MLAPADGTSPLRKPRKKSAGQKPKPPNIVWTSDNTKTVLAQAYRGKECLVCGLRLGDGKSGMKRIAVHAKQHYTCMYCPCGYHSQSRDRVAGHQAITKLEGHQGELRIHEVDQDAYPDFTRSMGFPTEMEFPQCIPTYLPSGKLRLNKNRLPESSLTVRQ